MIWVFVPQDSWDTLAPSCVNLHRNIESWHLSLCVSRIVAICAYVFVQGPQLQPAWRDAVSNKHTTEFRVPSTSLKEKVHFHYRIVRAEDVTLWDVLCSSFCSVFSLESCRVCPSSHYDHAFCDEIYCFMTDFEGKLLLPAMPGLKEHA